MSFGRNSVKGHRPTLDELREEEATEGIRKVGLVLK
jgi:hypothetical protein